MIEAGQCLGAAIARWVAAGRRRVLAVPRTSVPEWYDRQANSEDSNRELNDEVLADLSLLCARLLKLKDASAEALTRAELAFRTLTGRSLAGDQFGEVAELLCTFSFISWRHSRALGRAKEAQEWLDHFDEAFTQPSVNRQCLEYFLAASPGARSSDLNDSFLLDSQALFGVCSIIREKRNSSPANLEREIGVLHSWVRERFWPREFQDEREYFLAQFELSAASCARWLGRRDACLDLLASAGRRFGETVEAESGMLEAKLLRLTVDCESHELSSVVAELPCLQQGLTRLGMATAWAKSEILRGIVLKDLGRTVEASVVLEGVLETSVLNRATQLRGFVLAALADCYALLDRFDEAAIGLQNVQKVMQGIDSSVAACQAKLIRGEVSRRRGDLLVALAAYREARAAYELLGMVPWVAYSRLLTGEVLLALDRRDEAEREILAALPSIAEQRMVPEGLAAVALLRDSIRRRRIDPIALRQLRQHLQGKR